MFVFVILDAAGNVASVNRSVDGAAHHAAAHAGDAMVGEEPLTIAGLEAALADAGRATVTYRDGTPALRIEHHGIMI